MVGFILPPLHSRWQAGRSITQEALCWNVRGGREMVGKYLQAWWQTGWEEEEEKNNQLCSVMLLEFLHGEKTFKENMQRKHRFNRVQGWTLDVRVRACVAKLCTATCNSLWAKHMNSFEEARKLFCDCRWDLRLSATMTTRSSGQRWEPGINLTCNKQWLVSVRL